MADLNFPNPGVQQTYTFVGKTWNWDGQRWAFASSGSGITKLNELTSSVQNFLIGYSGAFPNIVSSGTDHTFNFPIAGTAATGLVNTSSQTFAGAKTFASTTNATYIGVGGVVVHGGIAISGNAAIGGSAIFTNTSNTNTIAFRAGIQGSTLSYIFPIDTPTAGQVLSASAPSSGVVTLSWEDDQTGAPAGGITQLNGLTAATQSFQTGTGGVDFGISSTTATHTFNLPDASASARGVITTGTQTIAGAKTFSSSIVGNLTGTATTSENVNVTTTTRSLTHYLTFTSATSGSGLALTTSAVGIGFTVNPAQNTLAAGTFIGNLSGTAATATNFYGSLVGNVTGTATTSQNVNVTTTTLSNNFYLTFANASSGSGLALTTSAVGMGLTYNPATNTLSAQLFTGTAFTARNSEVTTTTRSSDHYLLFANASSGTGLGLSTSAVGMGLTYNPATNTLSAEFFTGTATTSRNVDVTTTTRSFTHYLTFTNASSGSGLALTTSTIGIGFTVNPSQNTLAAGTFIGNLSGTAATATNFYGTLVGNSSTATTSQNVNTVVADTAGNHYLTFSPANGGSGVALSTDGGLAFVPTTNVLTTGVFSGNLSATGATVTTIFDAQGDVSLGNATGDTVTFNARIGSHFNPSSDATYDLGLPSFSWRNAYLDFITGTAVTATNFYGTLTGNSSTATTSANLNTVAATTGTGHYLLFSPTNGGSGIAVSSDAQLQFSPDTNVLTADIFSGNLSGTAATATNFYGTLVGNSSTATTSQNINVNTTTAGGNFYLTFTNQSSGSGLALTTSTIGIGFTVNPAQNTLAAGTFIGNLSGTAATTSFLKVTSTSGTALNIADRVTVQTANNSEGLNINSNYSYAFNIQDKSNNNRLIVDVSNSRTIFTGNSAAHEIRVFNNNESTYFGFKANSTGSITYILPPGGPSTGSSILQSDNLGNMIWVPMTSGLSSAITSINSQTGPSITLETGSSGSDFAISQSGNTITFNLPDASASNRGLVTNGTQTIAGSKTFSSTISGNLSGTATTSQNVNVTTTTAGGNFYLTFTNQSSGSGLALTTSAIGIGFTVNPAQNTLAAGTFIGNLSGAAVTATNFYGTLTGNSSTATTSGNINTVAATTGTGHYILFSPVNGASGVAVSSDAQLLFSPSTNVLTADIFSGNLSGTAATVTNFYGALTGNVTGTATTAQNVNTAAFTNNNVHYITFTLQGNGAGAALSTSNSSGKLTYRPSDEQLSVTNITGTAFTATNFYGTHVGAVTGNVTGTATTAQNLNTVAATTGTGHYLLFSPVNGGSGIAVSSDAQLQFSPATNVLTADTFSGNLSGTAATVTNFYGTLTGNVTGTATTAQNVNTNVYTNNSVHYLTFTLQGNGAGAALSTSNSAGKLTYRPADEQLSVTNITGTAFTATNFYGTHVGSVTGNVTGTATTAQNVNTVAATTGTGHYLLFSPVNGGSGVALSSDAQLQFSPSTNVLTADTFSGNLSGTAATATNFYGSLTGTATTAQNVNVTTTTAGGTHYLTFTNATSGSGLALTTSTIGTGFTVNPAQNTLAAGTFIGNVSGSATTSTYITGILRNASYVLGDLLAGASTGNTLTRVPVGANDRYFLKPDSTTQSGLGWSTFAGVFVTSLAPASPAFTLVEGDLWYKVDDGSFNVYYTDVDETAQWVEIVSSGGGSGGGAGAAGGSAFEVQYNSGGVLDGDPNLIWGPSTPSLSIKGFPVDAQTGCALQILGPAKTITASTGTFFGINTASGYTGKMIDVQNNDVVKFSVASDGATTIATLTSNGTVYSNGGTLTNSNPSDQNLKENIQSMIGGASIVNQLNPVSFEWKSGIGGTGTKYGFIAQEVQEIIPDIVSIDSSGTIGLDTVSLIPFLVKSIKEQQETIEQLRAEIQFIKTELGI